MFYEMVKDTLYIHSELIIVLQVRTDIPYMARFDEDWATSLIGSQYATHLRSDARKNHELKPDPHYDYLKANSAKRRPGAPRGRRLGLPKSKGQTSTDNSEEQEPGPSGAGPSSQPNVNTATDEEKMDAPGMFGTNPSDDESTSGLDDDPDFE